MQTAEKLTPLPDYDAIKAKQNAAWASGDYAKIGATLQIVGEHLAEHMDLQPGSTVLDVAAGNGNATLAFARRWCEVTSSDYVEDLLARCRMRAKAEGANVSFELADAEDLPFGDGTYDAVVSTFGVMFTPNQEQSASELLRVCRAGGRIGLANWTAPGFIGQLFKTLGAHLPPPPGTHSPARWGDAAWIQATFGPRARELSIETRNFQFRYRSPKHFVEFFRTFYGPVHKAFAALDPDAQQALEADLYETVARFDVARDGSMSVPAEYVEVFLTKK